MSELRVALLQMTGCGRDQSAAIEKGTAFCRQARQMGADIALFPEMWNVGYTFFDSEKEKDIDIWKSMAVGAGDNYVKHFKSLAVELEMAIAVTYLEKWSVAPRNTVSIIDRSGEIILTYAKVHTCDFGPERETIPGEEFPVCTLSTAHGEVKIGCMICYDREHPESARILMLNGAEIILTPNACGLDVARLDQFKTRAYENMVGVAMTNYAAPQENGHSVAFNPIDKLQLDNRMIVIEAGESEGVYMATFDMEGIRNYREHAIWGNAFRRPKCYDKLLSTDVAPPFVRERARR